MKANLALSIYYSEFRKFIQNPELLLKWVQTTNT